MSASTFLLWFFSLIISVTMYALGWIMEIELNKLIAADFTRIHKYTVGSLISFVIFSFICLGILVYLLIKRIPTAPSVILTYVMLVIMGSFGIALTSITIHTLKTYKDQDRVERLQRISENCLGLSALLVGILIGFAFGYISFTGSATKQDLLNELKPSLPQLSKKDVAGI